MNEKGEFEKKGREKKIYERQYETKESKDARRKDEGKMEKKERWSNKS